MSDTDPTTLDPLTQFVTDAIDRDIPVERLLEYQQKASKEDVQLYKDLNIDGLMSTFSEARETALRKPAAARRQEALDEDQLSRAYPGSTKAVVPYHAAGLGMTPAEFRSKASAAGISLQDIEVSVGRSGMAPEDYKTRAQLMPSQAGFDPSRVTKERGALIHAYTAEKERILTGEYPEWYNKDKTASVKVTPLKAGFYGSGEGIINPRDELPELAKEGSREFDSFLTTVNAEIEKDAEMANKQSAWGSQDQGIYSLAESRAQRAVKRALAENPDISQQEIEKIENDEHMKSVTSAAMWKTVGYWTAPIFVNYEFDKETGVLRLKRIEEVTWREPMEAARTILSPTIEIIGMRRNRITGQDEILARQVGATQTVFDLMDLAQSGLTGVAAQIAPSWLALAPAGGPPRDENIADAALRGAASRRNALEYMFDSELAQKGPVGKASAALIGGGLAIFTPDITSAFGLARPLAAQARSAKQHLEIRKILPEINETLKAVEGHAEAAALVREGKIDEAIELLAASEAAESKLRKIDVEKRVHRQFAQNDEKISHTFARENSDIRDVKKGDEEIHSALPLELNDRPYLHPSVRKKQRVGVSAQEEYKEIYGYAALLRRLRTAKARVLKELPAEAESVEPSVRAYASGEIHRSLQELDVDAEIKDAISNWVRVNIRQTFEDPKGFVKRGNKFIDNLLADRPLMEGSGDLDLVPHVARKALWKIADRPTGYGVVDNATDALRAIDRTFAAIAMNLESRALAANKTRAELLARYGKVDKAREAATKLPLLRKKIEALSMLSEHGQAFSNRLQTVFGVKLPRAQADRVARIVDAVAKAWAARTGKHASTFWEIQGFRVDYGPGAKYPAPVIPKQTEPIRSANKQLRTGAGRGYQLIEVARSKDNLPMYKIQGPDGKVYGPPWGQKDPEKVIETFLAARSRKNRPSIPIGKTGTDQGLSAETLDLGLMKLLGSKMEGSTGVVIDFLIANAELASTREILKRLKAIPEVWKSIESTPFTVIDAGSGKKIAPDVRGQVPYQPETEVFVESIEISGRGFEYSGLSEETLTHEILHAATLKRLWQAFTEAPDTDLGKIFIEFEEVQKQLLKSITASLKRTTDPALKKKYEQWKRLISTGTTAKVDDVAPEKSFKFDAIAELISHAFTDPDFQKLLSRYKAPKTDRTLLTVLFDAIRNLFGIEAAEGSSLARVIMLTDELLNAKVSDTVVLPAIGQQPRRGPIDTIGAAEERNLLFLRHEVTPSADTKQAVDALTAEAEAEGIEKLRTLIRDLPEDAKEAYETLRKRKRELFGSSFFPRAGFGVRRFERTYYWDKTDADSLQKTLAGVPTGSVSPEQYRFQKHLYDNPEDLEKWLELRESKYPSLWDLDHGTNNTTDTVIESYRKAQELGIRGVTIDDIYSGRFVKMVEDAGGRYLGWPANWARNQFRKAQKALDEAGIDFTLKMDAPSRAMLVNQLTFDYEMAIWKASKTGEPIPPAPNLELFLTPARKQALPQKGAGYDTFGLGAEQDYARYAAEGDRAMTLERLFEGVEVAPERPALGVTEPEDIGRFVESPAGTPKQKQAWYERAAARKRGRGQILRQTLRTRDKLGKAWKTDSGIATISDYEYDVVKEFVAMVGTNRLKNIAFAIEPKIRTGMMLNEPLGLYFFGRDVVGISHSAVASGRFVDTTIHELWHGLSQYLPDATVNDLYKQFARERGQFMRANPEAFDRAGRLADINMAKNQSTYRFSSFDEWVVEKMKDLSIQDASRRLLAKGKGVDPTDLPYAKPWQQALRALADLVQSHYNQIKVIFGRDVARKTYDDFMRGKYADQVRDTPLAAVIKITPEDEARAAARWSEYLDALDAGEDVAAVAARMSDETEKFLEAMITGPAKTVTPEEFRVLASEAPSAPTAPEGWGTIDAKVNGPEDWISRVRGGAVGEGPSGYDVYDSEELLNYVARNGTEKEKELAKYIKQRWRRQRAAKRRLGEGEQFDIKIHVVRDLEVAQKEAPQIFRTLDDGGEYVARSELAKDAFNELRGAHFSYPIKYPHPARSYGVEMPSIVSIKPTIVLNETQTATGPRVFLHEMMHALTSDMISNPVGAEAVAAAGEIQDIYYAVRLRVDTAKAHAGFGDDLSKAERALIEDHYGLKNQQEFVAEAFTNPRFQDFLRAIPAEKGKPESLWDRFVTALMGAFGIKPEDQSILREVLESTDRLITSPTREGRQALPPEQKRRILYHKVIQPDDTVVKRSDVQWGEDGSSLIQALNSPDVASALYSIGRILRRVLDDEDDIAALLSWIRTQSDDFADIRIEGNRFVGVSDEVAEAAEEAFAEAFVKYVMKEEPPTVELEDAFRLLRTTLREIYLKVRPDTEVEVSDDVKSVFDRLLVEPPKDNIRFPTAMKVTYDNIFGTPEKREIAVFEIIAKEAERLGITGRTIESLKTEMEETGRLVFDKPLMPERRGFFVEIKEGGIGTGKYEINRRRFLDLQLAAEREQLIVKGMAKPEPGLSKAQSAFDEMTMTESMRQMAKSKIYARAAIGIFFGGDPYLKLRDFSPVVRDSMKAGVRTIEQTIGDATTLGIEDATPFKKKKGNVLQQQGRFLGGENLRFEEGRPILTAGHDYMTLAGDSLRSAWEALGLGSKGQRALRESLSLVAELVDDALGGDLPLTTSGTISWSRARGSEGAQISDAKLNEAMSKFFPQGDLNRLSGLAEGLHNAAGVDAMSNPKKKAQLLELILYYNGLTQRKVRTAEGQPVLKDPGWGVVPMHRERYVTEFISGTSTERAQAFLDEFKTLFDDPRIGDFRARHAAVIVAAQGAAAQSRSLLSGVDLIVDKALYNAVQDWRQGKAIKADMYPRLQIFLEKIGVNPELSAVDTILDQTSYMPKELRNQLAIALQKSHIRTAEEVGKWDPLKRLGWVWWNFLKTQLIRGSLSPKRRYFTMNTFDSFVQMGMRIGFIPSAQHTIRLSFGNVLTHVPYIARATWYLQRLEAVPIVGAEARKIVGQIPFLKKGLDPHAQEHIREALQDAADFFTRTLRKAVKTDNAALKAVQDWLGAARYDIRINPIMRGSDELIQVGNKVYLARDVRDTATQAGIFASFQTRALERNLLKANVESFNRAVKIYEGVEGRKISEEVIDGLDDVLKMTSDIAEAWAERERLGAMITLMEFGYDPQTAAKIAVEALFDYPGSMSKADKYWLWNMVMPFWAYEKNARAYVFNQLFSPWGAYRMGVLRRGQEYGTDAMSWLLYEYAVDPYGIDTRDMDEGVKQSYYAFRTFLEFGAQRPLENLPPGFQSSIRIAFNVDSLADLPPKTRQFLENGYGGPGGVPKNTKLALRMMFTGTGQTVVDGSVVTLNSLLRQDETRHLSAVAAYLIPPIDKTKRRSYRRTAHGAVIPEARNEEVRRYIATVNQVDPGHTWTEVFFPESTIQAGMRGIASTAAFILLMGTTLADLGSRVVGIDDKFTWTHFGLNLDDTLEKASYNLMSDIFPADRALLRELIAGPLPLKDGSPAAIHPALVPLFEQFFPVDFIHYDAKIDRTREQFNLEVLGMTPEESARSAQTSPQRVYLPYGTFSFVFKNFPGLRELNNFFFLQDVREMPAATVEQQTAAFVANALGLKLETTSETDVFKETVTGTKRAYEPPL